MMTFYDWLCSYKGSSGPIKDLANDVQRDPIFPRTATYEKTLKYLESKRVHRDVLKAFEKAYKAYKVATRS